MSNTVFITRLALGLLIALGMTPTVMAAEAAKKAEAAERAAAEVARKKADDDWNNGGKQRFEAEMARQKAQQQDPAFQARAAQKEKVDSRNRAKAAAEKRAKGG